MSGVIRSPKVYDVCIIGSGAAGGVAAREGIDCGDAQGGAVARSREGFKGTSLALRSAAPRRGHRRQIEG